MFLLPYIIIRNGLYVCSLKYLLGGGGGGEKLTLEEGGVTDSLAMHVSQPQQSVSPHSLIPPIALHISSLRILILPASLVQKGHGIMILVT